MTNCVRGCTRTVMHDDAAGKTVDLELFTGAYETHCPTAAADLRLQRMSEGENHL